MKHSKKVLTASIALLLGVSGAAFGLLFSGNLLENPGFEDPVLAGPAADDWTQDAGASRSDAIPRTDTYSMFMSWDGDAVFSGSAYQMETVEDCSPYGLGMYEASGWHNNEDANGVPSLSVFFDDILNEASSDDTGVIDGYQQLTVDGNIPPFAMMAKFMVSGAGDGVLANVHWDDVEFSTDCVADYAKVSGKAGVGERGRDGRNGKYSFSGAIGTLESEVCGDANPVGMLHINYKTAGYSCDFTPEAPVAYVDDMATLDVSYVCDGDELPDDGVGDATIVLTQGAGGAEGKNKNKDRGTISVTNDDGADLDGINIDADVDPEIHDLSLTKGNVNLMQPEACI